MFIKIKDLFDKIRFSSLQKKLNTSVPLNTDEFQKILNPYITRPLGKDILLTINKILREHIIQSEENIDDLKESEEHFLHYFEKSIYLVKNKQMNSFPFFEQLFLGKGLVPYFNAITEKEKNKVIILKNLLNNKKEEFEFLINSQINFSSEQTLLMADYLISFHNSEIEETKIREYFTSSYLKNALEPKDALIDAILKEKNVSIFYFMNPPSKRKIIDNYFNLLKDVGTSYEKINDQEKLNIIDKFCLSQKDQKSSEGIQFWLENCNLDFLNKVDAYFKNTYETECNQIGGVYLLASPNKKTIPFTQSYPLTYKKILEVKEYLELNQIPQEKKETKIKFL